MGTDAAVFATRGRRFSVLGSDDVDEVADENQRLTAGDDTGNALRAVCQILGDDESASSAHLHALHTVIPPGNHLTGSQLEGQRLSAVPRRIEFATGTQGHSDVVHLDEVAGTGLGAVTDSDVVDDEFVGAESGRVTSGLLMATTLEDSRPHAGQTTILP